jgi:chromosome segregation protein
VLVAAAGQIGVVEAAQVAALQSQLAPGQRLVSKEGDLWRWDGYSLQAGRRVPRSARLVERRPALPR